MNNITKQEEKQNHNSNGKIGNDNDENDDLYGDLQDETTMTSYAHSHPPSRQQHPPSLKPSTSKRSTLLPIDQQKKHDETIQNQLKKQIEELQNENGILKRNIGTLYRTAKLELDRKDARIAELEFELSR